MNDDHDPKIQFLFSAAEQELPAEDFTGRIQMKINKQKRSHRMILICLGLILALCLWLLSPFLQNAANLLIQSLIPPVFEMDNASLTQILSPLNNRMAVLALSLIILQRFYRKIIS